MTNKPTKQVESQEEKQPILKTYYLSDYGISVEAASVEEAVKKAEKVKEK